MERSCSARALGWLVAAGALLRAFLVFSAENRLDCDEATVGVMALDVLEGRALPLFFYGNEHNGGAALEAYLGALMFAVFGASEVALKLTLLLLWTLAASLFADVCRRSLAGLRPFAAVLFFCVATPFLLEWSVKARGGYAETVLFSVVLLWLVRPPQWLEARPRIAAALFGSFAGFGLWASQMLLPLLPCAATWLLARRPPAGRVTTLVALIAGFGLGLAPLLAYNALHAGAHLQAAVPVLLLRGGSTPLAFDQLIASLVFVLGAAAPVLLLGMGIGLACLGKAAERTGLARVAAAHVGLYLALYTIAGLRHLPIPPARLLYALYPSFALLLAVAMPAHPGRRLGSALAGLGVAVWLAMTVVPVVHWAASGSPRETGSWRAGWCLVDAPALHQRLRDTGAEVAYVTRWNDWPLRFAGRLAERANPELPPLRVTHEIPRESDAPRGRATIALPRGTPLLRSVRLQLAAHGVPHRVESWRDLVLLSELDASRIHQGTDLPALFRDGVWRRPSDPPDGFN